MVAPPSIEQLRAAMDYGWKDWHYGDPLHDADFGALDTILDAARFLLSVLEPSDELVGKVAKAIRERAGSYWVLDSGAIARAALAALSDKEER